MLVFSHIKLCSSSKEQSGFTGSVASKEGAYHMGESGGRFLVKLFISLLGASLPAGSSDTAAVVCPTLVASIFLFS